MYQGDFKVGSMVRGMFTTSAASGAAIAPLSGYEAADLIIYKNGSAAQRASASGVSITSPFDSIVGLHAFSIDLTDNADAGFYAAGNDYFVVLSADTETVDGQVVVSVLTQFSIQNRNNQVDVVEVLGEAADPDAEVHIADGAISAATFAADTRVPADVLAVNGDDAPDLVGGLFPVAVAAMGANTITAGAIAADAIGASELAASAVTEIANAVGSGGGGGGGGSSTGGNMTSRTRSRETVFAAVGGIESLATMPSAITLAGRTWQAAVGAVGLGVRTIEIAEQGSARPTKIGLAMYADLFAAGAEVLTDLKVYGVRLEGTGGTQNVAANRTGDVAVLELLGNLEFVFEADDRDIPVAMTPAGTSIDLDSATSVQATATALLTAKGFRISGSGDDPVRPAFAIMGLPEGYLGLALSTKALPNGEGVFAVVRKLWE